MTNDEDKREDVLERDEYDVEFTVRKVEDGIQVTSKRCRKVGEFNFNYDCFEGFQNEIYVNEQDLQTSAETEMENWGKHDETGLFQEIGADIRYFSVFYEEDDASSVA